MTLAKKEKGYEILNNRLDNRYVSIIYLGQQVTIVLASDRMFFEGTPRLRRSEHATLSLIAQFIRQFKTDGIHVGAYTSKSLDKRRDVALTEQQAKNIMQNLWKEGLGTTMISGLGYGSSMPIANDDSLNGQIANRRVEIQFQWIPKDA